MAAAPPRKKLRQAAEASGKVSTLCFSCRRTEDRTTQQGLSQFFTAASTSKAASTSASTLEQWTCETCTLLNAGSARTCKACEAPNPASAPRPPSSDTAGEALHCSKCRRSMEQKVADRTVRHTGLEPRLADPQKAGLLLTRLRLALGRCDDESLLGLPAARSALL